jgi:Amt family ammonium transporter
MARSFAVPIARLAALALLAVPGAAFAQEAAAAAAPDVVDPLVALTEQVANQKIIMDTMWVIIASALVFAMQLGFAYVEGGFTRAKNANNIMMKNLLSVCVGTLAFMAVGFTIMFGNGNGFWGYEGWFLTGADNSPAGADAYQGAYGSLAWATVPFWAKVFFQLMFAATAGTIISGAVAERTKFSSYLIVTAVVTAVIYPVVGHWAWGGGWLSTLDPIFTDFAGSTVVHLTGGTLAAVGAYMVGARKGKYGPDGKPRAIPGHSLPMATLGVFVLWLGWFGFNAGSTMAANTDIALIAINTNMGAAAGAIGAMLVSLILFRTFDIGMTLNGVLCGLVAVTAGCYVINPLGATIMGFLGGVFVVFAVLAVDRFIDDPVGAIAVHGGGGALGTIFVGLFAVNGGLFYGGGAALLITQLKGVLATIAFAGIAGFILFAAVKYTIGLRVSAEEEFNGLDLGEHGLSAYPDPAFGGGTQGGGMLGGPNSPSGAFATSNASAGAPSNSTVNA